MSDEPTREQLDAELAQAKAALDDLEDVDGDVLVERLRAEDARHPFLLMRGVSGGALAMGVALSLFSLVLPLAITDLARMQAGLDRAMGLPLPLVLLVLSGCALLVVVAAHQLVLLRAASSPLLPHERAAHQHLVQQIVRIETRREVAGRLQLTPTPYTRR